MRSIAAKLIVSYVVLTLAVIVTVGVVALTYIEQITVTEQRLATQELVGALAAEAAALISGREAIVTNPALATGADAVDDLQDLINLRYLTYQAPLRVLSADEQRIVAAAGFAAPPDIYPQARREMVERMLRGPMAPPVRQPPVAGMRPAAPAARGVPAPSTMHDDMPPPPLVAAPIVVNGTTYGYLQMMPTDVHVDSQRRTAQQAFALASAIAVAVAVLCGAVISRRITGPIVELSRTVRTMAAGRWTGRAPVRSRDEIATLALEFNAMADRVADSLQQITRERDVLRMFIDDASHHLRTPLTAVLNYYELLAESPGISPTTRLELIQDSRKELGRINWIVQSLLTLTRFDAGVTQLRLGSCDLAALVESAAKTTGAAVQITGTTTAVVDAGWLEIVFVNLLENAVRYATATDAGTPALTCSIDDTVDGGRTWHRITIANPGRLAPGVDSTNVFERFRRGHTSGPGSGLGLAIAHRIVTAHHGKIELTTTSAPDRVLVCVLVPADVTLAHPQQTPCTPPVPSDG